MSDLAPSLATRAADVSNDRAAAVRLQERQSSLAAAPHVAAVVPTLDEAGSIGPVVSGLLSRGACCVFVVNGGSIDGTAAAAERAGAVVIHEPRRGYGRACLTGAAAATATGPVGHGHGIVTFLDGDGSCDPADLPSLVGVLSRPGGADVALGRRSRRDVERGALPWQARVGNALVAAVLRRRTGRVVHDLAPFKALRAEALTGLCLDATGYGWTVQLVARALAAPALRVVEVPIRFRRRSAGRSKITGSLRTSIAAGIAMVQAALHETRPRPIVALIAKAPQAGNVKTRLGPMLGEVEATRLWTASLRDTADVLAAVAAAERLQPIVVAPSVNEAAEIRRLLGHRWTAVAERWPGLGGAISTAFVEAVQRGSDRAIVVGGDNPDLPHRHVADALRALEHADAVIGPTLDGGYHLVALRWRPVPVLGGAIRRSSRRRAERLRRAFMSVPMGGRSAAESTREALADAGWRSVDSAPWPDLDTPDDLAALAGRLDTAGPEIAPAMRAWLAGRPIDATMNASS